MNDFKTEADKILKKLIINPKTFSPTYEGILNDLTALHEAEKQKAVEEERKRLKSILLTLVDRCSSVLSMKILNAISEQK